MNKDILIYESQSAKVLQQSVETFAANSNALYAEAKRIGIPLPTFESIRPLLGAMLRKDFSGEHIAFSRLLDKCELKTEKLISLGATLYGAHREFSKWVEQDAKGNIVIRQDLLEKYVDETFRCYADDGESKTIQWGKSFAQELKKLQALRNKNDGKGAAAFTLEENTIFSNTIFKTAR